MIQARKPSILCRGPCVKEPEGLLVAMLTWLGVYLTRGPWGRIMMAEAVGSGSVCSMWCPCIVIGQLNSWRGRRQVRRLRLRFDRVCSSNHVKLLPCASTARTYSYCNFARWKKPRQSGNILRSNRGARLGETSARAKPGEVVKRALFPWVFPWDSATHMIGLHWLSCLRSCSSHWYEYVIKHLWNLVDFFFFHWHLIASKMGWRYATAEGSKLLACPRNQSSMSIFCFLGK